MDKRKVKPFELPKWTNILPADSYLNANDMADILGIKRDGIGYRIKIGQIPEADRVSTGNASAHFGKPIRLWSLGCLRRFVADKEKPEMLGKSG